MTSPCWVRVKRLTGTREAEADHLPTTVSLEQDILPHIGTPLVPDELIRRLGKCLQTASRLYELDLPGHGTPLHDTLSSNGSLSEHDVSVSAKETRFDSDFDRQARGQMFGTTAEVVEVGRERFGYWCFDLLFLLCSDVEKGALYLPGDRGLEADFVPSANRPRTGTEANRRTVPPRAAEPLHGRHQDLRRRCSAARQDAVPEVRLPLARCPSGN